MKNLIQLSVLFIVGFFLVACGDTTASHGFSKSGKAGSLGVVYSSDKPLVVGNNTIRVDISQEGKALHDAKVVFKVFMPEMPGMPYMEEVKRMQPKGDGYEGTINFSMGGTWQVQIVIEKDGKKYKYASSVIL